jgi:hypothetical protein
MSSVEPPTGGLTGPQVAPPGDQVEPASGMVALVSTAVLVFVAVALAVAAYLVYRNASDMQAEADRIERVTRQHAVATTNSSRELIAVQTVADHTYTTLGALMAAYQAQLAAQNHAIDVANGAAAAYNAGQTNIADALQTEAQAAVADAETKTAAVHTARVQVTQAFAALQQASG